jgi:hypothetical protein
MSPIQEQDFYRQIIAGTLKLAPVAVPDAPADIPQEAPRRGRPKNQTEPAAVVAADDAAADDEKTQAGEGE